MATTGNQDWAYTEARRRAKALERDYTVYRHRRNTLDYIIRPAADPAPNSKDWNLDRVVVVTA